MEDGTNQSSTPVPMSGAAAPLSVSGAAGLAAPPSCELSLTREKSDVKPGDGRTKCLMSLHTETNLACAENCSGTYVFWPGHGTTPSTRLVAAGAGAGTQAIMCFACEGTIYSFTFLGDRDDEPGKWVCGTWKSQIVLGRPQVRPEICLTYSTDGTHSVVYWAADGAMNQMQLIQEIEGGWRWVKRELRYWDVKSNSRLVSTGEGNSIFWSGEGKLFHLQKSPENDWKWSQKL